MNVSLLRPKETDRGRGGEREMETETEKERGQGDGGEAETEGETEAEVERVYKGARTEDKIRRHKRNRKVSNREMTIAKPNCVSCKRHSANNAI